VSILKKYTQALKELVNLAKAKDSPVRITEMLTSVKDSKPIFIVQITNKNIFLKYTPSDLMNDKSVFNLLSKEDSDFVKNKVSQKFERSEENPHRIIAFEYHADINQYIYNVRFLVDGKPLVRDFTLPELIKNNTIMEHMNQSDVALIGLHQNRINSI